MRSATLVAFVSLASAALAANFNLVKDYSGTDFFNDWTYYGHFDDLNNGRPPYHFYMMHMTTCFFLQETSFTLTSQTRRL